MQKGKDITTSFPGVVLVHHNLPGITLPSHDHSEHEIFIPLLGEISFEFEHVRLVCGPGKMVYIPPKTKHSFRCSSVLGERVIALVDDEKWKLSASGSYEPCMLPLSQLCRELLFYLLLNPSTKNSDSLVDTFIKTVEEAISIGSQTNLQNPELLLAKVSDSRLKKALELMLRDFSEDLTQVDIARRSGLSLRSMVRLFSAELGLTPKQTLTHLRISKAAELLAETETTVTDTAFSVGYGSLSSFIKNFQALTGQLPSEVLRLGRKQ